MLKEKSLTLDYLQTHPQSAIKVIEALDTAHAAAFLETVPVRLSASVISKASPWMAATWIEKLPLTLAATVLLQMNYQEATAIIRLLTDQVRTSLIDELPSGFSRNIKRSLTYPIGTVGAWMDQTAPTFPDDMIVADGLKFLKSKRGKSAQYLMVVNSGKKYAGVVSANELLHSPSKNTLKEITDESVTPLSSMASLATALNEASWDRYSILPVIGSKGNVAGSLQRSDLKRGLNEIATASPAPSADSIMLQLFGAYAVVLFGLTKLFAEADVPQHQTPDLGERNG